MEQKPNDQEIIVKKHNVTGINENKTIFEFDGVKICPEPNQLKGGRLQVWAENFNVIMDYDTDFVYGTIYKRLSSIAPLLQGIDPMDMNMVKDLCEKIAFDSLVITACSGMATRDMLRLYQEDLGMKSEWDREEFALKIIGNVLKVSSILLCRLRSGEFNNVIFTLGLVLLDYFNMEKELSAYTTNYMTRWKEINEDSDRHKNVNVNSEYNPFKFLLSVKGYESHRKVLHVSFRDRNKYKSALVRKTVVPGVDLKNQKKEFHFKEFLKETYGDNTKPYSMLYDVEYNAYYHDIVFLFEDSIYIPATYTFFRVERDNPIAKSFDAKTLEAWDRLL